MSKIEALPFHYKSCGGNYGGTYACATDKPTKGIVLFHGHSGRIDKGSGPFGKRQGAEFHLNTLVEELAAAHHDWAVLGISTRGYGDSWAGPSQPDKPDSGQYMDWVSEITQRAAADGVREFRNKFNLSDEQLFLWGHSEGGQMAMLLAAKYLQNVAGVISYSGVLDHAKFVDTNFNSKDILESHEELSIFPKDYYVRSPINYVGQVKCPVLIWFSYEDDSVRPEIPISFGRSLLQTNENVIALSFEGGHGPTYSDLIERPSKHGFGYAYKDDWMRDDWMWQDYFARFIDNPSPTAFAQEVAIHDPLGETALPDINQIMKSWSWPDQWGSDSIRRAITEGLALSVREHKSAPAQWKAYFDSKDFFLVYVLERRDIFPEDKATIVESLIGERGRGAMASYQILDRNTFEFLFSPTHRRSNVAMYDKQGRFNEYGHWTDLPGVKEALLASNKLNKYLTLNETGRLVLKTTE